MPVDEVNELLGADLPEGDWDTIGGLFLAAAGHVPTEGESVEADGHLLVAENVQGRRIGTVRVMRLNGPPLHTGGRPEEDWSGAARAEQATPRADGSRDGGEERGR